MCAFIWPALTVTDDEPILSGFSNRVVRDLGERRRNRRKGEVPFTLEACQLPRGQGQSRPIDYAAIRYIVTRANEPR